MKKSIKLQAAVVPGFNKVLVKVLAQSHTCAQFGAVGNKFRASNGIVLASNAYPARDTDDKNVIWLRGSNDGHKNTTFYCSSEMWPKIVKAVTEYNNYAFPAPYVAPRPVAAPAANACCVIIG